MKLYLCNSIGKLYDGIQVLDVKFYESRYNHILISCLHTSLFVKKTYHLEWFFDHTSIQSMYRHGFHHTLLVSSPKSKMFCKVHVAMAQQILSDAA